MSKIKKILIIVFAVLLTFTGCKKGPDNKDPNHPENQIEVSSIISSVEIKDTEVDTYDFKNCFKITVNKESIDVKDEYIDKTNVKKEPGEYEVICTYENKKASVFVKVTTDVYEITLLKDEITIYTDEVENYDFLTLFKITLNGKENIITKSMIDNQVKPEVGQYTFTVSYKDISKTLVVHVEQRKETYTLEVIPSYEIFELSIDNATTFDYTRLFSLYVNGQAVRVTLDMIDISEVKDVEVGKICKVSFKYEIEGEVATASTMVKIVEKDALQINAKNVITYPNGGHVDLTSLFEIIYGDKNIPVTLDMIEGSIDYTKEGINTITLKYQGVTKTATVEVKRGVIIDYAYGDTIVITKGTNQATYPFFKDFILRINGIKFTTIDDEYLDVSNVDFNTVGQYSVTLKIPYNDSKLGLSSVKFKYYEKTITYVVVENNYKINILDTLVTLPEGTKKYNVFDNLDVLINNRFQTLTRVKENVDLITCYAEELSDPIDFNKVGMQDVRIALYVNGVDANPVIVTYQVMMDSNVEVSSIDKIAIEGSTIFTKDLFTIVDNGENIQVTNEMISGKVDTFVPGTYEVSISYKGIIKKSKVIVLNKKFVGTYHTKLKTVAVVEEDEDYGTTVITPSKRYGDIVINEDLGITMGSNTITVVDAVDENTIIVKFGSSTYTMTLDNGILILNPDNSIKLGFTSERRPFVYFHEDMYTVGTYLMINSTSSYIIESTITGYSIDAFNITSKIDGSESWYALKVRLNDKTSADSVYSVAWGAAEVTGPVDENEQKVGYISFNDENIRFVMESGQVGKVSSAPVEKKFAGITFEGTVDGKPARLVANQYEAFTLVIDGKTIYSFNINEQSALKNGGVDYVSNTLFLYNLDEAFSYKFILDKENKTFEYISKDLYFGKYVYEKICIFLDGYGTGIINFNTSSYYQTQIKYTTQNSDIKITYVNTSPTFEYGENAQFYIDDFKNTLISRSFMNDTCNDIQFVNENIVDGAIVRINSYQVGCDADVVAKVNMLENIEIITKDGVLTYEQKTKVIDTSKIKFSKPGFYLFTITLQVGEETIVGYYAMEVISDKYKDNPVVGEYGNGIINSGNYLSIDKYGQVIIQSAGILFRGNISISEDLSFVIKASNADAGLLTATGSILVDGTIVLRCTGAITFSEYFTKGTSKVTGTDKVILYEIKYQSQTTYILAQTTSSMGEIVSIEELENSIIKINASDRSYIVKILNWGNTKNGIQLADNYRGTYTLDTKPSIIVDGFGNVRVGENAGTYILNNNVLVVTIGKDIKTYKLNTNDFTYEIVDITFDESMVSGKTYEATYTFVCSGYYYTAITKFKFSKNGVVTIYSTSDDHDSGEKSCSEDLYDPIFGSKKGKTGSYTIQGNRVTISVNGVTFELEITNVLTVNELNVTKTSLSKDEQGFFSVDTLFTLQ